MILSVYISIPHETINDLTPKPASTVKWQCIQGSLDVITIKGITKLMPLQINRACIGRNENQGIQALTDEKLLVTKILTKS